MEVDRQAPTQLIQTSAVKVAEASPKRFDLLQIRWLRRILVGRWPLLAARAVTLAGFVFIILAGIFGSRVGSHNFAIIFVWIAWWTALKLVFIPAGGRSWCSICPIPMPGEWIQQGGVFRSSGSRRGLRLPWPKKLRGYWLQGGFFLAIGLFSAVTLTDPRVTAWVLLGLILLAVVMSLVFERRSFCSYICPIGGFTGLYAQAAPVELRVKDNAVCKTHAEKTCYQECPWGVYPAALRDNAACGLCMECVRVCPHDNLAVNLRPFGQDLFTPRAASRHLDEAFLALVMLGSALAFSAVFTGPWGWLKNAAFAIGSPAWLGYSASFLALTLGLVPGLYIFSVWTGLALSWTHQQPAHGSLRQALAQNSLALLPLGLFAWIAFTISFAFPKISFVLSVLSDPLGRGWNLFGTAGTAWNPDVSTFSPALQAGLLLLGLFLAGKVAGRQNASISGSVVWKHTFPVMAFCILFTLAMLWLLIG
jgi:polyferredoxin